MSNYLTDMEYYDLLVRMRKRLDELSKVEGYDSEEVGNKYTTCNVGLCDDDFLCTKENTMWPDDFPRRKSLKYFKRNHKCPMDNRVEGNSMGCFYHCRFFKNRLKNIEKIKELYDEQIKIVKGRILPEPLEKKIKIKISVDDIAAIMKKSSALVVCVDDHTSVQIQLKEEDLDYDRDDYEAMFEVIREAMEI